MRGVPTKRQENNGLRVGTLCGDSAVLAWSGGTAGLAPHHIEKRSDSMADRFRQVSAVAECRMLPVRRFRGV